MIDIIVDKAVKLIEEQSIKAVYYHLLRTGQNTAVIINTTKDIPLKSLGKYTLVVFISIKSLCRYAIRFITSIIQNPKTFCDEICNVDVLKDHPCTVLNDLLVSRPENELSPPVVEVLRDRKRTTRIHCC